MGILSLVRAVGVAVGIAGLLAAGSAEPVTAAPRSQPGEQLYVAPWGNDAWPGTAARPFATLAGAQRAVRARTAEMDADIVVNLRGGIYTLADTLRFSANEGDSGTHGHRVVYQAYGYGTPRQEPVTISGGRRVTGWRPAAELAGAWRADVGDLDTRQLFVNGRTAQRTALGRGLPGEVSRTATGYVTDSAAPQSWRHPQDIELVFNGAEEGLPYSEARCGVADVSGTAEYTIITVDQPCFQDLRDAYDADVPGAEPGNPTDVENSPSLLRKPGTWYLDRSRPGRHVLYYLPRHGEDPRRVPIVASALETLVLGEGDNGAPLHDIAFKGLTFSHATWLRPSGTAGFPQVIGSWYYAGDGQYARMPANVVFHAAERIVIEGNRFVQLGSQALALTDVGRDNAVHGNVFEDLSGGGVELRGDGSHNRVEDNRVHHIGTQYRGSIGIVLEGPPDSMIAHNQVNDVPYSGIWGESPHGLQVVNNLVFDAAREVPDGGGIYLPFAQGTNFDNGAMVRGNVVRDVGYGAGSVGVYPDVGADWVTLEHNLLYGNDIAVSGVQPRRIRVVDNYWDDDEPFWWPEDTPTDGVIMAGNILLPRTDPAAACRTDPTCANILATAGPRTGS